MSKADSIQAKLDKAYGIVAKNLGRDFEIYRPATIDDPLNTANYIDTKLVSFSKDEKYKKGASSGMSLWNAWVDGRLESLFDLQNGDILYNSQTDETYIMVGMEPHLTHQAIKANQRIVIERSGSSGYGNADGTGFAPGNITGGAIIAQAVPCQVLQPSSYGVSSYINVSSNSEDSIPNFEIYMFDYKNEVNIRDKVTDFYGNTSEVQAIYHTDIGTKLTCRGIPQ